MLIYYDLFKARNGQMKGGEAFKIYVFEQIVMSSAQLIENT